MKPDYFELARFYAEQAAREAAEKKTSVNISRERLTEQRRREQIEFAEGDAA